MREKWRRISASASAANICIYMIYIYIFTPDFCSNYPGFSLLLDHFLLNIAFWLNSFHLVSLSRYTVDHAMNSVFYIFCRSICEIKTLSEHKCEEEKKVYCLSSRFQLISISVRAISFINTNTQTQRHSIKSIRSTMNMLELTVAIFHFGHMLDHFTKADKKWIFSSLSSSTLPKKI